MSAYDEQAERLLRQLRDEVEGAVGRSSMERGKESERASNRLYEEIRGMIESAAEEQDEEERGESLVPPSPALQDAYDEIARLRACIAVALDLAAEMHDLDSGDCISDGGDGCQACLVQAALMTASKSCANCRFSKRYAFYDRYQCEALVPRWAQMADTPFGVGGLMIPAEVGRNCPVWRPAQLLRFPKKDNGT